MIRIVLDTNVLVSGIMAPQSPPAQILRQITEGQVRLLVSEPIKQEAKAVLGYSKITKIFQKQGISQKIVTSTLTNLLQIAITTPGKLVRFRVIDVGKEREPFRGALISFPTL